jgi:diaminopimelate epimerase
MTQPFIKMNGLGNDFVVIDARKDHFEPSEAQIVAWADRGRGIGFDQLIAIEQGHEGDAFMRVWNSDGSSVETCGNALRCVAWVLGRERADIRWMIDTRAGPVTAQVLETTERDGIVSVDMGRPKLDWTEIPLSEAFNTERLELQIGPIDAPLYHTPCAVNMGNPHVVFFVEDVSKVEVERTGSLIENHPLFPEGVNVEFAEIIDRNTIRMRVWERGAGITKACGTGACATLVAAARRGKTERHAHVIMDGGPLHILWRADDHVIMTGPIKLEFEGRLDG